MKYCRLLALTLVLALGLTACGGTDSGKTNDTTPPVADDTDPVETEITDGLPADLNYNNETVNILNMEYIISGPLEYNPEESVHSQQASIVQEANYYRRIDVEERLGVKINFIEQSTFSEIPNMVRQSINSGSNDYDMVFTVGSQQVGLSQEGMYLPIDDLPYVDLDNPWWNKEYIESISVNTNNPYILFGDTTYNTIQRTMAVLFNKKLMKDRLGISDTEVYEWVLDGTWTIDKMKELAEQIYEDDGNMINDYNDIHGIIAFNNNTFHWLAYSAGLEFTSRDEDGYPVININSPSSVDVADKLLSLLNGEYTFKTTNNGEQVQKFADGKALFLANRLFMCDWEAIREMQDDYGIIPMPKYDESIDGYHACVDDLVQWGAVPVTVEDPAMISAVAEALAFYGYKRVTPAYYETALKFKYTRGDANIEGQILDIITQGARTDFLFMTKLGSLGNIFGSIGAAGQNNFASLYEQSRSAAEVKLQELIKLDEAAREG